MISVKKNIYLFATLVVLVCFCFCHFAFSYYSRLESDDYNLIAYLRDKGFFGTIKFIYFSWEGAFGVLMVSLLKIKFALFCNSVFIHNVVSTLVTFYCFYYFIKTSLFYFLNTKDKIYSFILTSIFYVNLYYNGLAINDTVYWLCGSIYFFMPALLLFFVAVFLQPTNRYFLFLGYIFFFLYGASRLNYAVILLSILGILFLYYWFKKKTFNKTIFSLALVVLAALIIYVVAPGNYIRRSDELKKVLTLTDYIIGPLKMSGWFINKYILLKMPYHIIFMLPALFIGYQVKEKISSLLPTNKKMINVIVIIVLFCLFCIYMQSLSMFIAKGSQMPRTLEMLSILTALCILTIFVLVGSVLKINNVFLGLCLITSAIGSFLLLRRIHIGYPVIKEYAIAVDDRHKTIEGAIKNFKGDTLVLKKLPPASWLHSGELTRRNGDNPMNNIFLEEYYKPNFVLDIEK